MDNNSIVKTLLVASLVCLVCGILVALSAVGLKDLQIANERAYFQKNILSAAGMYEDGMDVTKAFESVEQVIVDLDTGAIANDKVADVQTYDQRKAKKDPAQNEAISSDDDIAKLRVRAKYAKAFVVKDGNEIDTLILPIEGYGLWSTLYGFLALGEDLNTVKGISFYEHAETPGLGGEVDNPKWKAQWLGKKIYDTKGDVQAGLKKGGVNPAVAAEKEHMVDGLSGATLTSNGVTNLIHYWMGNNGFAPFIQTLKAGA